MTSIIVGIIAFAIGAFFGVAMMCCFFVASESDKRLEKLNNEQADKD